MLEILNAREREEAEWRESFRLADTRFKFLGVTRPEGIEFGVDRGALGRVRWSQTSLTGQPAPTLHIFFPLLRHPRDDTQRNSTKI